MLIKDLIQQLQELHDSYSSDYKEVMGEPEISIDLFRRKYPNSPNYDRIYGGISNEIVIERNPGSWYTPVIVSFGEAYDQFQSRYQTPKDPKNPDSFTPWPESWQTQNF
jgi:hypothetical protein